MKRITNIKLHNFRAFFGGNYQLSMPNGENVLIYGENGSGKSSIYNALKDFFESSEKPDLDFKKHIYSIPNEGSVKVTFSEFPQTNPLTPDDIFDFNTQLPIRSANTSNYIKKANKARAFLSYQELAKSYIAEKDETGNPNLYNYFIDTLLADYVFTGPNFNGQTIREKWLDIQTGLDIGDARFYDFNKAESDIPKYIADLIEQLRIILPTANQYLRDFFKNEIQIDTKELTINRKAVWGNGYARKKVLKLNIFLYGDPNPIENYHLFLNEARLSAIAICLYLAAIKRSPQPDDYKIIFLDDVFIGLDTSNRIPLLELIKAEFPQHQVFISTYDRFWYETAIRWFNVHNKDKWKYFEVYVHNAEHKEGRTFDKPILTSYQSNFAKGQAALKNEVKPDYPSAANNFRKYAEELLTDKMLIPEAENRNQFIPNSDEYGELTKGYKLTQIVENAIHFLNSIHQDTTLLLELKGHLNTLLHPLSHFELASPVYKGELLRIENCLINLTPFLESIKSNFRVASLPLKKIRLNFTVSATVIRRYAIVKVPQLYVVNDGAGNLQFSICECYTPNVATETVGQPIVNKTNDTKNNPTAFKFISLLDACTKLRNADIAIAAYSTIPAIVDYIDNFEYQDAANNWQPLRNLLIW